MKIFKVPNNKCFWLLSCFIYLMIGSALNVYAADASLAGRDKVGLALGGGGALGLSHIGVLKWFEENRIPVDYISGTSMGGLIGGCYATGMSPDEIHTLIKAIDWDNMFSPEPPFNRLEFRRKEDARHYPVVVEMGLRNGLGIPNGLGAYNIELLLSRIALPYSCIENFDELPIPYRCVATDITNSKKVIIGDGSLAEAMRATMAVPGVFTPVKRNGRMLVDGGVVDNVPADVVKQMGASIVIAVHLNMNHLKKSSYESVLLDTISTAIEYNTSSSLKLADIIIEPKMANLSVISWKEVDKFIAYGYQSAAEQAENLLKFSMDEAAWQKYLQERKGRRILKIPIPKDIEVIGASPFNALKIKERLKSHLNKPIDTLSLEKDLTGIMGSCLYENLRYQYILRDGVPVLHIDVIEKSYGPPFIEFALLGNIDGYQAEHVDIAFRLRGTFYNLTGSGSELRVDLGIGTELYYMTELYKPVFNDKWFVAPMIAVEQKNSNLFNNDQRLNDYKITWQQAGIDLGHVFNNNSQLRIGYFIGYQDTWLRVGNPLPADWDGGIRKTRLKWTFTNSDAVILAKQGIDWDFNINWYDSAPGSAEPFGQLETKTIKSFPVNSKDLITILFEGGYTFQGNPPVVQQFYLGGPFRLGSYKIDQFHDKHYLLTNVGYLRQLAGIPLVGDVYLGFWLEHGGVFQNWSNLQLKSDLSLGLLGSTILGPIYIGASLGNGSNPFFNIKIGYIF